jgi:type I restriction enzyme M protein
MDRVVEKSRSLEADLFPVELRQAEQQNLPDVFRRIYYHLYSNSKASRAELIIEDLSLLLLCKLAGEFNGGQQTISTYLEGKGTANKALLPILREAFPELLSKRQTFSLADDSLRMALSELATLDLTHAPAHALGEAFQALIGPRLRGERGQFFTPKSLVRAMVEVLDPQPGERVCDPACGTGGFLSETHIYQASKYQSRALTGALVGVDKDEGLARLASAMMKVLTKERGHVHSFNSLSLQDWVADGAPSPLGTYDVVLTNPPFGAKIGIKDESILRQFDFGHVWTPTLNKPWVKSGALSASADPQTLFLEFSVRLLKVGGRMGIVLPEGMFGNKQSAYVWDWLEAQGEITALLDCPRTTFQPGTDTKTNVLFFRKGAGRTAAKGAPETRVAVALHCGHDRRGRSVKSGGEAHADDFPKIARAFHVAANQQVAWRNVQLLGERYLVPRYYYDAETDSVPEHELLQGARFATLGELVKEKTVSIRKGHEVGSDAYGTGEIPFVRTSDLSNFEISSDPTKAVSEQIYEAFAPQQKLQAGDILMVVDGRYRIGTTAMLTEHNSRCIAQSHLRIISAVRREKLDPYELLFALNLPSVKLRLRSLVFIQSTLGTLGNRLLELRIPVLHGDGAWASRVEKFRDTLQKRSALLADLEAMAGHDYEL